MIVTVIVLVLLSLLVATEPDRDDKSSPRDSDE